jgi:hypothetical protein
MLRSLWRFAAVLSVVAIGTCSVCWGQADTVELKLRLKKGDTFKTNVATSQEIDDTYRATPVRTELVEGIGYEFRVEEVDAEGIATLTVRYDWTRVRTRGPRGVIAYDSRQKMPLVQAEAKQYAVVVGQSFRMKLAPNGEVREITGADEMLDAMLKAMGVLQVGRERRRQELALRFGDKATLEHMRGVFIRLPDKPVAVGESWKLDGLASPLWPMELDNTWTLKSRDNGLAEIQVKTVIAPIPNAPPLERGEFKLRYLMRGTHEGTVRVSEATGWPLRGTFHQTLSGTVEAENLSGSKEKTVHSRTAASKIVLHTGE